MLEEYERWITSAEAAKIITKNSGHTISDAYVRRLALNGKLSSRMIGGKTRLFNRAEVEQYTVKKRDQGKGTGKAKREARARREKQAA